MESNSTIKLTKQQKSIYSKISTFSDQFSIDWILAISDLLATNVLSELEEAAQKGWLKKEKLGCFQIVDQKKKQEWSKLLCKDEKERIYGKLYEVLTDKGFDNSSFKNISWTLIPYFLNKKNDIKDCKSLMSLGRQCVKAFKAKQAFEIFRKIIGDLSRLDGKDANVLFCDAAVQYAKFASGRQHTTEILQNLKKAYKKANRLGNEYITILLLMQMSKNEMFRSHSKNAAKYIELARIKIEESSDEILKRNMNTFYTLNLYWQGRYEEAVKNYEKFVPLVEKYPRGEFPLLIAAVVGHCYTQTGEFSQGIGLVDAIRMQSEKIRNRPLLAHVLLCLGANMIEFRQLEEAGKYLELSAELSKNGENEWIRIKSMLLLAFVHHLKGNNDKASINLCNYLDENKRVGFIETNYTYLLYLYWAVEKGFLEISRQISFEDEIDRQIKGVNLLLKGVAYRFQAMLQEERNQPKETIIETLKTSLHWLEKSGHRLEISKTCVHIARQYSLLNRKKLVKEFMEKVSNCLQSYDSSLLPDDIRSVTTNLKTNENIIQEIMGLSQKMITIRDERVLLRHIISAAIRLSGAERGAIFLVQEGKTGTSKLFLKASKNLSTEQIESPDFKSSMSMIEKAAKTGRGSIHDKCKRNSSNTLPSNIIQSRICVPMRIRDKTLGVMYHDNRILSSAFESADLEMLAYFASQSAIALDILKLDRVNRLKHEKLWEERQYYKGQHIQDNHFNEIKGESDAIKKVLIEIEKVAETDSAVLILGETGVGKELVARAIHRKSHRCDNPYITVHCSALPENLISSELFGHEKGAFTGADRRRIGRFELADKGILFLDELGDIPLDIQIKLLRVLQSHEFERVGGSEVIHSDFRVVSATNQDLDSLCRIGKFRKDLLYRINVISIVVPPLRERREDIPILAQYFLDNHSRMKGMEFDPISDHVIDELMAYDWPGNVRELENIVERGTILSSTPDFRIPDIINDDRRKKTADQSTTLEDITRNHILWALDKKSWKIRGEGGVAEFLNLKPSTLVSKMKKLGIERPHDLKKGRNKTVAKM